MHSLLGIFSGLFVAGSLLQAGEPPTLDAPFLSRLREEAARHHPSALAGQDRASAAAREVRAVRLWSDPMLGIGFMGAGEMMRADDGDVMFGIEQALPKPGLFAAERARREALWRSEAAKVSASTLDAGAQAARAAIELALADESVASQQAQVDWLAAMAENARQMAADPMTGGADALRMETELAREREVLAAARRGRDGAARTLNLALGRPLESAWPALKLPAHPSPVPLASAEVIRVPRTNPQVLALRETAAAAAAEARMAERERLPEIAIGAEAQLYSGTGDLRSATLGLKLSLPWFNESSYQAKIDAAKAREAAAHRDVESARREIAARIVAATTEAANAAAQARAIGGEIREKAEKAARTTEAAWISSKAPLNDLLDAARLLHAIRLEHRRLIARQLAALEEIHSLVPNRGNS
jgi:outer membrane protein TolC